MLVTAHFYASGDNSGWSNAPDAARANLAKLAALLESFRTAGGGVPMRVTSGYRSSAKNATVGGSETSQHLTGSAADVAVSAPLRPWLESALRVVPRSSFGQLIVYPYTTGHVHLSLPNRASGRTGEILVEVGPGTYRHWEPGTPFPAPLSGGTATVSDSEGARSPLFIALLAVVLAILATLAGGV